MKKKYLYLTCLSGTNLAGPASNGRHPLSPLPCCSFPTTKKASIPTPLLTSKRWPNGESSSSYTLMEQWLQSQSLSSHSKRSSSLKSPRLLSWICQGRIRNMDHRHVAVFELGMLPLCSKTQN